MTSCGLFLLCCKISEADERYWIDFSYCLSTQLHEFLFWLNKGLNERINGIGIWQLFD